MANRECAVERECLYKEYDRECMYLNTVVIATIVLVSHGYCAAALLI